jgi:peptidoglycan/LPS O-acetylase OafA/YrhL
MKQTRTRSGTDRLLLLEAGLVLLLFALFVILYFVPVGEGSFAPQWWTWPLLVGLFFGILALEHRRRKQREQSDTGRSERP